MSDVENDGRKRMKKDTWDPANMRKAVGKVLNNEMSARQAADRSQVPRTTLNDRVSVNKHNKEMSTEPRMGRFQNTFSPEHEKILVEQVKDLANRLMPLNRGEFLNLAFRLAEKLKLPHQFNKEKESAGKNYCYSFMKRHSDLSLPTPESTSLMRAVGRDTLSFVPWFSRGRLDTMWKLQGLGPRSLCEYIRAIKSVYLRLLHGINGHIFAGRYWRPIF